MNLVHWTIASAGGDYVEGGQTYRPDKGELWPIPKYDYLEFGFAHYQNYSSFVPSFDAWLDEIVVDDERVGCAL